MAASRLKGQRTGAEASLLVGHRGSGVAVLTLNRRHVHNALDRALMAVLEKAIDEVNADPAVRAVVITGAGESFCSGDDLKALRDESIEHFAESIEALQSLAACLFTAPKPVVAALNGPAYGAGLELILACDARIASDRFAAGTPEVRLGLVATNGASVLLPLLVGQSKARLMLLGGEPKDAHWCLSAGLVDRLVPDDSLLDQAVALAEELGSGAPAAVAATRRMLGAPLQAAFEKALLLEAEMCIAARRSDECAEGVDAFFSRRKPAWRCL